MSDPLADFTGDELSAERLQPVVDGGRVTAVDVIDRYLWDGRVIVRRNAAHFLRLAGRVEYDNLGWLTVVTKDSDPVVREHAVAALATVGLPPAETVPALMRALCDPSSAVNGAALEALEQLTRSDPDGVSVLLIGALGDPRPFVVATARDLLMRAGDRAGPLLVAALLDPSTQVAAGAAATLKELGGAVTAALIAALGDPARRGVAAALLARLAEPTAAEREALAALVAGPDAATAAAAQGALDAMTGPRRPAHAPLVLPTFDFADAALDPAALDALAKAPATLDLVMVRRCLADGRAPARANAAALLGRLGDPSEAGHVAALVRDQDPAVRLAVVHALQSLKASASVNPLVRALDDPQAEVAAAAQAALASLDPAHAPAVLAAAAAAPSDAMVEGVLAALSSHGAAVAASLGRALSADRAGERVLAARGLERLGSGAGGATDALIAGLDDAVEAVAVACATALGGLVAAPTDPAGAMVHEALGRATASGSGGLRRAASAAIGRLLGLPAGPKPPLEAEPIPFQGFETEVLGADRLAAAAEAVPQERLTRALTDGRALVRLNATAALGGLGDSATPATVEALGRACKDSDASVRAASCGALGALGAAAGSGADALVAALADPSPAVAAAAARGIAGLAQAAVPALVAALAGAGPANDAAGVALGRLGKPGVAALIGLASDDRADVQRRAVAALGQLGTAAGAEARAAVAAVFAATPDAGLMRACSAALDAIDGREPPPVAFEAVELPVEGFDTRPLDHAELTKASKSLAPLSLIALLSGDGRSLVRANAARGLQALGAKGLGTHAEAAAVALGQRLRDGDSPVAVAAAQALGALKVEPDIAAPALVRAAARAGAQVDLRLAAREALDAYGDAALAGLADALDGPDEVAEVASQLLAARGGAGCEVFIAGLGSDRLGVRRWSAAGVGLLGESAGPAARAALALAFESAREDGLLRACSAALDAVDGIKPPPTVLEDKPLPLEAFAAGLIEDAALKGAASKLDVDRLSELLFDGREACRANAARALGHVGKGAYALVPRLVVALKDGDEAVRVAAAEALGRLGRDAEDVVPALAGAFARGREGTREAALAAVDALGKDALGPMLALLHGRPEQIGLLGAAASRAVGVYLGPLQAALTGGESVVVQENAADTLGSLGQAGTAAEATLLSVVEASDVPLKCKAIRAVGQVGKPTPALSAQLSKVARDDRRGSVGEAVDDALRTLRHRKR